jgi:hypothetical protein
MNDRTGEVQKERGHEKELIGDTAGEQQREAFMEVW